MAACPGGNVSNFVNSCKRERALSVSLTAIATMLAIVLTPFNFYFYGKLYKTFGPWADNALLRELTINPIEMLKTVIILLGIPIVLGMVVNHKFPKFTEKIKNLLNFFAFLLYGNGRYNVCK